MKLTPEYIEENIWPSDMYRYYLYENSLMSAISEGYVYIEPTGILEKELDKMRAARGYKPFFAGLPKDQIGLDAWCLDGWYTTILIIEGEVATKIIAYATHSNDDDREPYEIPLDRETGLAVYKKILRGAGDLHK